MKTITSAGLLSAGLATLAYAQSQIVTGTVTDSVGAAQQFSVTVSQGSSPNLFPQIGDQASSVYPWAQHPPGVTYNGGIPARATQCGPTLMPLGGGQSDTSQIQAALNACPAGQHVQLGAGVFLIGTGSDNESINITNSNITLRGVGPGPGSALPGDYITGGTTTPSTAGCGSTPCTILYKNGWQSAAANPYGIIYVNQYASSQNFLGTSINLAQDAVQGATTITLSSAPSGQGWGVGSLVLLDMQTINSSTGIATDPDVYVSPAFGTPPNDDYGWFSRAFRSIAQIVKIIAVNGNTLTIESPVSMSFTVARSAQLTPYSMSVTLSGIGVEELYLYGGGGGHGNLDIDLCDSCWVKHIESHWMTGMGVGLAGTYRTEIRDSYIHESQEPIQGGGGYLLAFSAAASNNLIENNIVWNGNKVDVMQATGGGNVLAYNYMDDSWNWQDPIQAEAGVNAGHFTTSHNELLEGNWSHKYSGDSWWGNEIYITVFRNWLTGLRGARGPLANYTVNSGGTIYPYCDCWTRAALDIQYGSYYHNIVGNVLGFLNMPLINGQLTSNFSATQTSFRYESLDGTEDDSIPSMYVIGSGQNNGPPTQPTLYQMINRQGNYDYVTKSQIWYSSYGGSGPTSTGSPQTLPNSLYLASKPAFFGTNPWPWVDPSTGTTYTLPAKARFDAGTPNSLP